MWSPLHLHEQCLSDVFYKEIEHNSDIFLWRRICHLENGNGKIARLRIQTKVNGATYIYGNNMSIIHKTQKPASTLKKKSNSICSLAVREFVAMVKLLTGHIKTADNQEDLVKKVNAIGEKWEQLVNMLLYDIFDWWSWPHWARMGNIGMFIIIWHWSLLQIALELPCPLGFNAVSNCGLSGVSSLLTVLLLSLWLVSLELFLNLELYLLPFTLPWKTEMLGVACRGVRCHTVSQNRLSAVVLLGCLPTVPLT